MNYNKEYKKYLISAILDNANNKIAGTTLMTAFAIYLGISDFWIGLYVLLDTITNIIQIFAAPLFSKIGQSKKVVLINYSIYRIASVSFAFIPFISQDTNIRTILFFIPAIIYAITGELGYITFVNWRMTLLKKEDRGKFSATKNAFKNTVVVLFSFLMGTLLDYLKENGNELLGFIILFFIVFIIAAIDIILRICTFKPNVKQEKINLKESIILPAKDKSYRKILLFCGLYRFAIGIGTVYLNVYILRYLNISYLYYSILNMIVSLSEALFGLYLSKKIKDRNWKKIITCMSILYIIPFICLSIFKDNILIYLLPIIYLLIGCGNSAYDLYDNIAIYEGALNGYETSYVTFERFIEGIITALIPIFTSTILSNNGVLSIKLTFIIALIFFTIIFILNKYFNRTYIKN